MIVDLPTPQGTLGTYELAGAPDDPAPRGRAAPFNRLVFAAAHVVASADATGRAAHPASPEAIDWDATHRFREHLWSLGFGIAEAMDTAQRETLGWDNSARLMARTLAAAAREPARMVIAGAGVDHLATREVSLAGLIDAYLVQVEWIHDRGGRAILFPTAILPGRFPEPRHYVEVYRTVSARASKPVFVHWLGESFAPALKGYFPGASFRDIMRDNPGMLGVKLSLLDEATEVSIRRDLARDGQIVLTGDDFNFPPLIRGTDRAPDVGRFEFEGRSYPLGDHSHALLGIFDGIATVASRALSHLAAGDGGAFDRLLAPTIPLSRHIFRAPTLHYKAGLVFLAHLNGHQPAFHLLDDVERTRDLAHYAELFRLANAAGVLDDPEAAYQRFLPLLHAGGFRAARRHG